MTKAIAPCEIIAENKFKIFMNEPNPKNDHLGPLTSHCLCVTIS